MYIFFIIYTGTVYGISQNQTTTYYVNLNISTDQLLLLSLSLCFNH